MNKNADGKTQSTVDFSTYSNSTLLKSLRSINAEKYPANFRAITVEIEKRSAAGTWDIESEAAETVDEDEGFAPVPISSTSQELKFGFLGSGDEYFPIWVSNFFLCVITLGFFTPWAKVRARRYFYSRTTLAQHTFSYSGSPWRILLGRIILALGAVTIFLNDILGFTSLRTFWLFILFALLIAPFIVWKSALFNFANSSYRGISFSMDLKLSEVYVWALTTGLKVLFSLGILGMTISYQYRSFFLRHLKFGNGKFTHKSSQSAVLKKIFPLALGVGFVSASASGIFGFLFIRLAPDLLVLERAIGWITVIAILAISDSITAKFLCDHLQLGPVQFRAKIDKWDLARLYIRAGFLSFVTLGFAWPWVRIDILRYKLERIKVFAPEGYLNEITQEDQPRRRGAGGFATELFEFDLGI